MSSPPALVDLDAHEGTRHELREATVSVTSPLPCTGMRMGIVIVTHNQIELAKACVRNVMALAARAETVVVVNDRAALSASEESDLVGLGCTLVVNCEHLGYGANLNRGVAALASSYEAMLLLNDDAYPRPHAIESLVAALAGDARAGVVGPAFVGADGVPQQGAFRFPSLRSELATLLILPSALQRRFWHRSVLDERAVCLGRVDWILGAAMLIRRTAFEQVAGFDESYFLYSEETDLQLRMKARGWHVLQQPEAVVEHIGAASTASTASTTMKATRALARSRGQYINRHWSFARRAALMAALPAVQLWNFTYSALLIAVTPRKARQRWRFFTQHWGASPSVTLATRRRVSEHG